MKDISITAFLSEIYTNHCIRATVIGILDKKHARSNIKTVTGHSSESSLDSYSKTPIEVRQLMCHDLHLAGKTTSAKAVSQSEVQLRPPFSALSTVSKPVSSVPKPVPAAPQVVPIATKTQAFATTTQAFATTTQAVATTTQAVATTTQAVTTTTKPVTTITKAVSTALQDATSLQNVSVMHSLTNDQSLLGLFGTATFNGPANFHINIYKQ